MIVIASVAALVGALVLGRRRSRREVRPDSARELAALAAHLSRSARAGMTVGEGIRTAAPRLSGPVGRCTAELAATLERGVPMGAALVTWSDSLLVAASPGRGGPHIGRLGVRRGDRLDPHDVSLFVCAVEVSRRWGSGLSEALDAVAVALLDRSELADEVRALTSQAGASTAVLCGIPVLGVLLLPVVAPPVFVDLVSTPPGLVLLGAATMLDLAAVAVSRRLTAVVLR